MPPAPLQPIDVRHLGRERVISAWHLGDGVVVDPGPASSVEALLAALPHEPRALLLTHIHLDHAGASGVLAARFPDLEVCVHERGAPHLADPSRLLASATRLYGDAMDELWGEVRPVPTERLRVLRGGETDVHGCEVAYAPGHASHHVLYRHAATGWALTGDVAGVRIPPSPVAFPPTPPPDIDVDAWTASIDLLAGWEPAGLGLTHFGAVEGDDVGPHLAQVRERLRRWATLARGLGRDAFVARVTEEMTAGVDDATAAATVQASPPEQLHAGLERYVRTRTME